MSQFVVDRIKQRFADAVIDTHNQCGDDTLVIARQRLIDVVTFLKNDSELQFNMPVDCTVVDWFERKTPRFEVVYAFYSHPKKHRIRVKVPVGDGDDCWCPSLTPMYRGMDWHEREAWDMYGVRFDGHPNLKRILMYEEFVGFPLRKDYPIDKRQPLIDMIPVREVPTQRNPPIDLLNKP